MKCNDEHKVVFLGLARPSLVLENELDAKESAQCWE